ncbi:MAG: peroxiredoxin-like family protein [Polyangiales bacterium]
MTPVVGRSIPDALGAAEVIDSEGHPHALATRWAASDALLVFVRHFACVGCAEHLAALRPRIDEITRLGVTATIIGSGSADQLAAFIEREDLASHDVACLTDPARAAYRAAGFQRSVWGTFGPIALGQVIRGYTHGFRNGRPEGDLHQQGGTLYVRRDGTLAFYHRAHHLGDHAKLVDVVDLALAERAQAVAP